MDKRLMNAEHKRGSLSVGLMLLVNSLQQHSCCLFVDLAELVVCAGAFMYPRSWKMFASSTSAKAAGVGSNSPAVAAAIPLIAQNPPLGT